VSYDPHSDSASLSCTRISLTAFQAGGCLGDLLVYLYERKGVFILQIKYKPAQLSIFALFL
jgi:hypothetical protein